jgi:hypothetical protein
MLQGTTDSESKSTIKVVQEVRSPLVPDDAHVMTVLINQHCRCWRRAAKMNKLSLLFNKPKGRFCEDAVCCRIELVTSFLRCDQQLPPQPT